MVEEVAAWEAAAVGLFASPWNGREAQIMLLCSHPNASFQYSARNQSLTAERVVVKGASMSGTGLSTPLNINLGWPDGRHNLFVTCMKHVNGREHGRPFKMSWLLDFTAPTTRISANPSLLEASTNAMFSFACSDVALACSFEYMLDAGAYWVAMGGVY